ncbi:EamA family transporter RarD [Desulfitobacterium sp. AusDCA]|uniref:EamA family transporter RarD n=1 Tax=Desulfitobacterium sp. AusDCA TaxID=3240383 RepID=UPI003DA72265
MLNYNNHSEQTKGIIYTMGAFSAWGLLPIYWKQLNTISPMGILANRIIWSFVFVAVLLSLKKQWGKTWSLFKNLTTVLSLVLSSFIITLNWLIYIWAVNSNHVVEASLGYYINPLITVLLGILVLHERLDRWQVVSIALAAIGILILTVEFGKIPWIALSLAITFALYGLAKRLIQADALTGIALETLIMVPAGLIYLTFFQGQGAIDLGKINGWTMLLLAGSGVVTATPLLWFAQGAKTIPFATVGFIQYVSPTLSLLLGVFLYKESFSMVHVFSFSFIWTAVAIFTISRLYVVVPAGNAVKKNIKI